MPRKNAKADAPDYRPKMVRPFWNAEYQNFADCGNCKWWDAYGDGFGHCKAFDFSCKEDHLCDGHPDIVHAINAGKWITGVGLVESNPVEMVDDKPVDIMENFYSVIYRQSRLFDKDKKGNRILRYPKNMQKAAVTITEQDGAKVRAGLIKGKWAIQAVLIPRKKGMTKRNAVKLADEVVSRLTRSNAPRLRMNPGFGKPDEWQDDVDWDEEPSSPDEWKQEVEWDDVESNPAYDINGPALKKQKCCCGATADTPCLCMLQGHMDCSAKEPMCPCYAEIAMGTEIEMEHTDDPAEAKRIAMEHLSEHPDYYTRMQAAGLARNPKVRRAAAPPAQANDRVFVYSYGSYKEQGHEVIFGLKNLQAWMKRIAEKDRWDIAENVDQFEDELKAYGSFARYPDWKTDPQQYFGMVDDIQHEMLGGNAFAEIRMLNEKMTGRGLYITPDGDIGSLKDDFRYDWDDTRIAWLQDAYLGTPSTELFRNPKVRRAASAKEQPSKYLFVKRVKPYDGLMFFENKTSLINWLKTEPWKDDWWELGEYKQFSNQTGMPDYDPDNFDEWLLIADWSQTSEGDGGWPPYPGWLFKVPQETATLDIVDLNLGDMLNETESYIQALDIAGKNLGVEPARWSDLSALDPLLSDEDVGIERNTR